jgi:DTW domain-containing protein
VPVWIRDRVGDMVCIVGEANAWPYRDGGREAEHPDELVHWVARRLTTGETFEHVLAPRNPLSARTPLHIDLSPEVLLAGGTVATFLERWRAFVRDTDVLCGWGHYALGMLVSVGGHLPPAALDVRQLARDASGGKVGTVEEFAARLGMPLSPPFGPGRAGARLARLTEVVRHLVALAG